MLHYVDNTSAGDGIRSSLIIERCNFNPGLYFFRRYPAWYLSALGILKKLDVTWFRKVGISLRIAAGNRNRKKTNLRRPIYGSFLVALAFWLVRHLDGNNAINTRDGGCGYAKQNAGASQLRYSSKYASRAFPHICHIRLRRYG